MDQLERRDYQDRIFDKATGHFDSGAESVCIELATGSGKTILGLRIAQHYAAMGYRTNWIAMRRVLLDQVAKMNDRFFGIRQLRPVSMFTKEPPQADITVVDEAQHDAVSSCVNIHDKSGSRFILGLTATPWRTDKLKLCFRHMIRDASIRHLIHDGWLSPFMHWTVEEWTPEHVASTYLAEPGKWGKSVVFFSTIAQCRRFAELLADARIHCEVVTASSPRESQLDAFDAGEFDVVANVGILNEGFDCPDLRTVFVRDSAKLPTVQMSGRAFRIHPGKTHCNIVQSQGTKWPFVRTATPKESHVLRDGRWLSLSGSERIDEIVRATVQKIATTEVEEHPFLAKRRPLTRIQSWMNDR